MSVPEEFKPEIDYTELALLAYWAVHYPEGQGAPGGIVHTKDEELGIDVRYIYDADVSIDEVLANIGITPQHLEHDDFKKIIAGIIRRTWPDKLQLDTYRDRLRELNAGAVGHTATRQSTTLTPTVDLKE